MKKKPIFHHHSYIVTQFVIIFLGGFLMYLFQDRVSLQLMILMLILLCYIVLGFVHHSVDRDLKSRIVIEYILISSLILAAFLFFNAGRI